jgi:hypothetical protein
MKPHKNYFGCKRVNSNLWICYPAFPRVRDIPVSNAKIKVNKPDSGK